MLTLTDRDLEVCTSLAEQATEQSGDASETFNILRLGFTKFGSEGGIGLHSSRQRYFEDHYRRLLKNHIYADRDFDYFMEVLDGRCMILRIVSNAGVPQRDVEDIVQEILERLWRGHWIEQYNPLISSWMHFIYRPVRNHIINYLQKSKRKKRYHAGVVRSDFDHVYNTNQEDSPESALLVKEFLDKWEEFLQAQPAFVRGDNIDPNGPPFKRLCTLLPPGTPEIPTESELTLYFLRKGTSVCRVAVPELYTGGVSVMVGSESLADYIAMDETTCESLYDRDGHWVIQKYFINPLYLDYKKSLFKSFDYLNFYHYLQEGRTIEEMAELLNLSQKSVPYWLYKIEGLFRSFWLITDLVPLSMKHLATGSFKCPACSHLNYQSFGVCESCCGDLTGVSSKSWFTIYPWPRVFMSREAKESHEHRTNPVVIKFCAT